MNWKLTEKKIGKSQKSEEDSLFSGLAFQSQLDPKRFTGLFGGVGVLKTHDFIRNHDPAT